MQTEPNEDCRTYTKKLSNTEDEKMSRLCRHTKKHGRPSRSQNVQTVQTHHKTRKLSHLTERRLTVDGDTASNALHAFRSAWTALLTRIVQRRSTPCVLVPCVPWMLVLCFFNDFSPRSCRETRSPQLTLLVCRNFVVYDHVVWPHVAPLSCVSQPSLLFLLIHLVECNRCIQIFVECYWLSRDTGCVGGDVREEEERRSLYVL